MLSFQASLGLLAVAARTAGTSTIYKLSEHLAFQTWGAGLAWDHRLMLCAAAEAEGLDEAALVAQRMRIRTSMRL